MKSLALIGTLLAASLLVYVLLRVGTYILRLYRQRLQASSRDSLQSHFVFVRSQYLVAGGVTLPLLLPLLAWWLWQSALLALLLTVAGLVLPVLLMRAVQAQRLRRLRRQLPDFVLSLALALQAGLAVQAALEQLAQSLAAPLGQEFRLLLRWQRLGMGRQASYEQLLIRVPLDDLSMFLGVLTMGQGTGTGMSVMLKVLAQTLRTRLSMEEKIQALTAQARLQARIMVVLPLLLAAVLYGLDPDGFRLAWYSPGGAWVAAAIVALLVTGMWWMRRILYSGEPSC
ncbi:type II secretion system F family protein [Alcaligenes sp. SDU_A2]|uniref:type II secretion system F family protein n=1 Tax=Alcaligenes sp. SDU_A2 TaxID=3136634 RepID=UPI00311DCFC3